MKVFQLFDTVCIQLAITITLLFKIDQFRMLISS